MTAARHALREPMVWLVMLLPAAVVVAGFVTLGLAIHSGGNDAVLQTVRRTAQIQTAELGPEERARGLGLRAVLQTGAGTVRLIPVHGAFDRSRPLRITFVHPVHAARDAGVELQPDATGWQAEFTLDPSHDWQLQLAPQDAAWRIHGRLPAGQQAAHLASSLHDSGDG